ncbi:MAG: aldo/keto reductase [gamma proteobacterium symbiont of Bathyaustriella thionipta]|nr:aldo/keto reductase [gamma proteobacterium symbiont of Bathyaustriella thionipta]MCU7949421.1 aldo/keto reductase [gamma proteobacterium symbiont of Bathyaustriella thionipta]MCU7953085.1 aldo/keto reductase [gamma proteobacterium symbiont of Bathyaustriella thionipta]MCU7956008.1 aldo/keto reductase [gamma proteobacterium symbiont of Bathyaustriella thionipta]MCU7968949.1 aldo/keto reductase [gamma proteobacterium symbiont of Bathyaustriella thionipta]
MEYRKLGQTNLEISLIGLGTMTWGFQNSQEEGFEQMDYALERGINFFDTAEMYAIPPTRETFGTTESIIGNWFASRKNRDKVILASKITGPGLDWIREGNNRIDKKNILLAVESSLQRLQTDYIDLYQLHWPNRGSYHFGQTWGYAPEFDVHAEEENFLEVLHTMQTLIAEGKIRHIGLSNETAWGMTKWLQLSKQHNLPRMASIQNEYSLLCRYFENDLSEIALHEQCGLLAWSPLSRGTLSGKYLNGARPQGSRLTIETRPDHRAHLQAETATTKYVALAKQYQIDPSQMALAFVNSQPFVNSTLIGATNMRQLKTNIDSIDVKLSNEILDEIAKIRRDHPLPY